eukprot:349907-Chlamydomonas_euryale.AAC.10
MVRPNGALASGHAGGMELRSSEGDPRQMDCLWAHSLRHQGQARVGGHAVVVGVGGGSSAAGLEFQ